MTQMQQNEGHESERRGYLLGFGCYAIWGFLPLYFHALANVDAFELVAHRVVWSCLFLALLIPLARQAGDLLAALRHPRILGALSVSALLIAINWVTYVWSVSTGHVVAASLGYFLNPLVNVLLGVLVLKERLSRGQMLALAIAGVGVAILAWGELSTLWISLTLAISFALYALVRKLTMVPAMAGLAVETLVLLPVALVVIALALAAGTSGLYQSPGTIVLLAGTGIVTSVPLILFAAAARRLPMTVLGLLQYVAPTIQFLIGTLFLHEHLSPGRWASFSLIWIGLALFVVDALNRARTARALAA
jgi:chloramphenicol-sensitive protein RarD